MRELGGELVLKGSKQRRGKTGEQRRRQVSPSRGQCWFLSARLFVSSFLLTLYAKVEHFLYDLSHLLACSGSVLAQKSLKFQFREHLMPATREVEERFLLRSTWLMAVAVVLSLVGNQVEEIRGGAAITVTPLIPFKIAQAWQLQKRAAWTPSSEWIGYLTRKTVSLTLSENKSLVNFLPHLRRVPNAIRPETKRTVCRRLTWSGQASSCHHTRPPLTFLKVAPQRRETL